MHSIIRSLEYKELSQVEFYGQILDIGGSKKSGYHSLIKGAKKIVTVNINSDYGCDLVFDIQEKFPIEDESFDFILSLNVFEHIFNIKNAFTESHRILKSGGKIVFAIPFMHQIHGSPDDFFRYTESALKKFLSDNFFEVVKINPLGYGVFGLLFQFCGEIVPFSFLRNGIKNLSILTDIFLMKIFSKYRKLSERIPLGYFVVGVKKVSNRL